ncbi:hypothetical protein T01_10358, partial [Trichinella spiralis]
LLSPARLHQDYDRMFRDILFELCLEIGVDQFDTSGTNGKWKLPRPRPVQAAAFHLRHPDSQQYFLKTVVIEARCNQQASLDVVEQMAPLKMFDEALAWGTAPGYDYRLRIHTYIGQPVVAFQHKPCLPTIGCPSHRVLLSGSGADLQVPTMLRQFRVSLCLVAVHRGLYPFKKGKMARCGWVGGRGGSFFIINGRDGFHQVLIHRAAFDVIILLDHRCHVKEVWESALRDVVHCGSHPLENRKLSECRRLRGRGRGFFVIYCGDGLRFIGTSLFLEVPSSPFHMPGARLTWQVST